MTSPNRSRRLDVVHSNFHPAYVVWELTLRCDHACRHCGSRAAKPREDELSTVEALEVVKQLAKMGTREVVLIGGEAYLHEGFLEIVRALKERGITPVMTTGGRGITRELAADMKRAGIERVSVSVDGLAPSHDRIRAQKGSHRRAFEALALLGKAGIDLAANTNVNRINQADLEPLYPLLRNAGVRAWQIQITSALGRAADHPEMLLQPYDLIELLPRVARLKEAAREDGITIMPGNNLGYFGPEEALLRSLFPTDRDHWQGCQAGKFVLGIESHGAVKGCPSLQSATYVGGSLKKQTLAQIWSDSPELTFNRVRSRDDLWGFCKTCPFADVCLAGCTFTAHALFGRPGNNPYCHFRARQLAAAGVRERLVRKTKAEGRPFDHALFEIIEEPFDSKEPNQVRATLPVASVED